MIKILWCGGSHLANARHAISLLFSNYQNTLYVTAGGANKDWSIQGGVYKCNGTLVGCNGREPKRMVDLSSYDKVVFVGQYVQPSRYFNPRQLLSDAVISEILNDENFLIRLPGDIYNQPLELFSRLHANVTLIPDPWSSQQHIDENNLDAFELALERFCDNRKIKLLRQPDSTLSKKYQTKSIYNRKEEDNHHFNRKFWRSHLRLLM